MFTLLANQTKLMDLLQNYSPQECEVVFANLKLTIELLNRCATELLANRRNYGVLLPQSDEKDKVLSGKKSKLVINKQLLLEEKTLIIAINSLCLTEAIIVRDNFSNCLELITEQNTETTVVTEKSNVSPIRLTEIKQRLAKAVQISSNKQGDIKCRLNKLLDTPTACISKIPSKQA